MGKKRGRNAQKNRSVKQAPEPEWLTKAPHSFVIHRGLPSQQTGELTKDFRQVMEPYTASQLKERKNNTIKDFVSIAGHLHVSHMCIFSMTKLGMYMKILRLPRGPTLTFKVHDFCFMKDVISSLKKQYFLTKAFHTSPLIVMNSFSGEGMHLKLMANMFQNMFPTINITNVKLRTIRRCVLLNYNPDTKLIDFRHYYIKMAPVGLTKGTKKIVQGKIPNLGRCTDMSEFFEKAGALSDSEYEDDPNAQITLPQNLSSRGAKVDSQAAVRLSELGPRLTLQLIKIEDGLMDGEVLYHEFIHKTEEEKEITRKLREAKKKLKLKRKKQQEENVKQKETKKEILKQKSLEGMKKKKDQASGANRKTETERLMQLANEESQRETGGLDDDDAEYYRQEVGAEPEPDLFHKDQRRKRGVEEASSSRGVSKKARLDNKDFKRFNKKDRSDSKSGFKSRTPDGKRGGKSSFDNDKRPFTKGKRFSGNKDKRSAKPSFKTGRPDRKGDKGFKKGSSFKNNNKEARKPGRRHPIYGQRSQND